MPFSEFDDRTHLIGLKEFWVKSLWVKVDGPWVEVYAAQFHLGSRRWNWKFREKACDKQNPELLLHSSYSFWPKLFTSGSGWDLASPLPWKNCEKSFQLHRRDPNVPETVFNLILEVNPLTVIPRYTVWANQKPGNNLEIWQSLWRNFRHDH